MIPSIANYFGITIDELFGYRNDRENKIDAIIKKIDAFHIKGDSSDGWVGECLAILREGLAEFPQNERLLITLTHFPKRAGDVIVNGLITMMKALFSTVMTFTKVMSIGRNQLKSANILLKMPQMLQQLQKQFIFSLCFTEM